MNIINLFFQLQILIKLHHFILYFGCLYIIWWICRFDWFIFIIKLNEKAYQIKATENIWELHQIRNRNHVKVHSALELNYSKAIWRLQFFFRDIYQKYSRFKKNINIVENPRKEINMSAVLGYIHDTNL